MCKSNEERPKILHINKLYYPHIGGVEKVVQQIAEGLADRVDVRVLVCQPRGRGSHAIINGVDVTRVSSLGILWSMPLAPAFPFYLFSMAKWADILHFHLPFPLGDLSYLIMAQRVRKKIVVTWHSDIVRQKRMLKVYGPCLKKFLSLADRIIVTSPAPLEHSPFLTPFKEKSCVIPLGIRNYWLEEPEGGNPARELPYPHTVLFVGRLCYYKGIGYLIDAMKSVDANLVIIGEGELRQKLQRRAAEIGIANRVFFMGKCSDEELKRWYYACDVFVLPSVEPSEAFGLVQVEAMAAGKPVINTNLPTGVPFVSINGETGFTVAPRDSDGLAEAINKILTDKELARKFSKNARARVLQLFTVETMLENIYKMYRELISN